jgi:predicted nucleotidyltransferase
MPPTLRNHLHNLQRIFAIHNVVAAYLFGSQATGQTWAQSDTDLAVLFDRSIPPGEYSHLKIQLLTALIGLLKSNDVDLICLNEAPPFIAYEEILVRGKLLFSSDEDQRIAFEIAAFHRYVDTKPLRELQRQYFREEILQRIARRRSGQEPDGKRMVR